MFDADDKRSNIVIEGSHRFEPASDCEIHGRKVYWNMFIEKLVDWICLLEYHGIPYLLEYHGIPCLYFTTCLLDRMEYHGIPLFPFLLNIGLKFYKQKLIVLKKKKKKKIWRLKN